MDPSPRPTEPSCVALSPFPHSQIPSETPESSKLPLSSDVSWRWNRAFFRSPFVVFSRMESHSYVYEIGASSDVEWRFRKHARNHSFFAFPEIGPPNGSTEIPSLLSLVAHVVAHQRRRSVASSTGQCNARLRSGFSNDSRVPRVVETSGIPRIGDSGDQSLETTVDRIRVVFRTLLFGEAPSQSREFHRIMDGNGRNLAE